MRLGSQERENIPQLTGSHEGAAPLAERGDTHNCTRIPTGARHEHDRDCTVYARRRGADVAEDRRSVRTISRHISASCDNAAGYARNWSRGMRRGARRSSCPTAGVGARMTGGEGQ